MNYKFRTEPYEHQEEVFNKNLSMPYAAYFMEMGTGKSKVLIDTVAALYLKGEIQQAFIVGLNGNYQNWISEIDTHLPLSIPHYTCAWKQSTGKRWVKDFDLLLDKGIPRLRFFLMNIEALITKKGVDAIRSFYKMGKTLFAIDESTSIKNHKAKRTIAAHLIGKASKYKRILTGTPIGNSPLDLFSQCEFLSKGLLGFRSFYAFRNYYGILKEINIPNTNKKTKIVVGYQYLEDLRKAIQPFSFIVKKKDCLSLPDKVYHIFNYELTPEQKRIYIELKKQYVSEFEGQTISAPIVLTRIIRLCQVLNGYLVSDDDPDKVIILPNNKIKALFDVLENMERPIIIWSRFRRDITNISSELEKKGWDNRTYFGDTTRQERREIVSDFQDGKISVLVANPSTAGYGLTLTRAHNCIYYSSSYSSLERRQSEDRLHRIGQSNKVNYVDLIAKGTIEEKILTILKKYESVSDFILDQGIEELLS